MQHDRDRTGVGRHVLFGHRYKQDVLFFPVVAAVRKTRDKFSRIDKKVGTYFFTVFEPACGLFEAIQSLFDQTMFVHQYFCRFHVLSFGESGCGTPTGGLHLGSATLVIGQSTDS